MKRGAVEIRVGLGSCGVASGAEAVRDALEREAREAGANGVVKTVGCNGMCHREPLVEVVSPDGEVALYGNVTAETARQIARKHIRPSRMAIRVRWKVDELKGSQAETPVPPDGYLAKQKRIVLENCGDIDPLNIDDYLARDGYRALAMCLGVQSPNAGDLTARDRSLTVAAPIRFQGRDGAPPGPGVSMGLPPSQTDETERRGAGCQACRAESHLGFSSRRGDAIFDGAVGTATAQQVLSPHDVIAAISDSGLRGRGGAGFPTGRKWALGRAQADPVKYVICNGDEGDPGAFMDRLVLESDPHRVLEGLAIAAYAIGAGEGYLYIRAEYPQAVRHARAAIRQAEQRGFLGRNILGSAFSLCLEVREGAGAFVCGEETALIQSLEGKRGMPKLRPPYPVECGLRGHPTVVNNVETLASVPWIIRHGAGAFAALGSANSRGTKVFALAGKVNRGGLIEVPMGITIREVVEDIGGGIRNGRVFKAVQLGGPSGGCIPARLGATPIDYDALAQTGAIMGSGGLVVLDDRDCMVDIARFFLKFTQAESCGKCTFCRIGTKRMLEILDRLCEGKGRPRRSGEARNAGRLCRPRQPVRARPDRAESGADHAEIFPRRIRSAPP